MNVLYGRYNYLEDISIIFEENNIEPSPIEENLAMITDDRYYMIIPKEAEFLLAADEIEALRNMKI